MGGGDGVDAFNEGGLLDLYPQKQTFVTADRHIRFVPLADIVPRSLLCVTRENVILCRRYRMTRGPHALASLKLGLDVSDVSFRKVLGCGASLIVCRSIDKERFQQSPTDHPTEVFPLPSQAWWPLHPSKQLYDTDFV